MISGSKGYQEYQDSTWNLFMVSCITPPFLLACDSAHEITLVLINCGIISRRHLFLAPSQPHDSSPSHNPMNHNHAYLLFAATLLGAPLACCLLAIPPRAWPWAVLAAVFAFSAFFLLSDAAFLSLASLMAAWRAAARASGRCDRRSLITSREAPTMARWCLTVLRVRFFATSYIFDYR